MTTDPTKCLWCNKKIDSADRPQYIEFRFGMYLATYAGGEGPYHKGCVDKAAKKKNERK